MSEGAGTLQDEIYSLDKRSNQALLDWLVNPNVICDFNTPVGKSLTMAEALKIVHSVFRYVAGKHHIHIEYAIFGGWQKSRASAPHFHIQARVMDAPIAYEQDVLDAVVVDLPYNWEHRVGGSVKRQRSSKILNAALSPKIKSRSCFAVTGTDFATDLGRVKKTAQEEPKDIIAVARSAKDYANDYRAKNENPNISDKETLGQRSGYSLRGHKWMGLFTAHPKHGKRRRGDCGFNRSCVGEWPIMKD